MERENRISQLYHKANGPKLQISLKDLTRPVMRQEKTYDSMWSRLNNAKVRSSAHSLPGEGDAAPTTKSNDEQLI